MIPQYFVKAISSAKNKPHVIVAYLSAELKTPDDLRRNNTNALYKCVSNAQLCLLMMISWVVTKCSNLP